MGIRYRMSLKNQRLQAVINDIGVQGFLEVGTEGMAETLLRVALNTPAFSLPIDGQMDLNGVPLMAVADASGRAAEAQIVNSAGEVIMSGMSAGAGPGHLLQIDNAKLFAGDPVFIKSGSIAHS